MLLCLILVWLVSLRHCVICKAHFLAVLQLVVYGGGCRRFGRGRQSLAGVDCRVIVAETRGAGTRTRLLFVKLLLVLSLDLLVRLLQLVNSCCELASYIFIVIAYGASD